jgi:hypothetical protein
MLGGGEAPPPPIDCSERVSYFVRFGCSSMFSTMVGTPVNEVTFSCSISCSARSGAHLCIKTILRPTMNERRKTACRPVAWKSGTASSVTCCALSSSDGASAEAGSLPARTAATAFSSAPCATAALSACVMPRCVSTTPLGKPVVPDVYMSTALSSLWHGNAGMARPACDKTSSSQCCTRPPPSPTRSRAGCCTATSRRRPGSAPSDATASLRRSVSQNSTVVPLFSRPYSSSFCVHIELSGTQHAPTLVAAMNAMQYSGQLRMQMPTRSPRRTPHDSTSHAPTAAACDSVSTNVSRCPSSTRNSRSRNPRAAGS